MRSKSEQLAQTRVPVTYPVSEVEGEEWRMPRYSDEIID